MRHVYMTHKLSAVETQISNAMCAVFGAVGFRFWGWLGVAGVVVGYLARAAYEYVRRPERSPIPESQPMLVESDALFLLGVAEVYPELGDITRVRMREIALGGRSFEAWQESRR